jgi:hypothetical protein
MAFLRQQGVQTPNDKEKMLYGVVVESSMPQGLDLLSAYPDRAARYDNYSGAAAIWELRDGRMHSAMRCWMQADRFVVLIAPWDRERPPAQTNGSVRLFMLIASGLYFGQGSFNSPGADPKVQALIDAAINLMAELTKLTEK